MSVDFGGALVAAATPFGAGGDVDLDALRGNLRHAIDAGVRGILIGGSTAEAVFLDDDERVAIIRAARDVIPADRVLLVGTGAESTHRTHALTASAASLGADAVLVQPPAFYRPAMTSVALGAHYEAVADRADVPVLIYQVPPKFSTIEFETDLIADLAQHANIVGLKDSRGNLDSALEWVAATPSDFSVLVGSGALIHSALAGGAAGAILGVANLAAEACQQIVDHWRAGRDAEAAAIQARVTPLHNAVIGGLGVPGVKAGLDLVGLRGGDPRPPLRPLDAEGRQQVRDALERADVPVAVGR